MCVCVCVSIYIESLAFHETNDCIEKLSPSTVDSMSMLFLRYTCSINNIEHSVSINIANYDINIIYILIKCTGNAGHWKHGRQNLLQIHKIRLEMIIFSFIVHSTYTTNVNLKRIKFSGFKNGLKDWKLHL